MMLLSARTESNQRCAKGAPSMNTSPQAGVHRRRPPWTPVCGGRPPKGWAVSSGGQNQDGLILLAPGHWALRRRKVRSIPDAQA